MPLRHPALLRLLALIATPALAAPASATPQFPIALPTPAMAIPPGAVKDLPPPPADSGDARADPGRPADVLRAVIDAPNRPAADRARDVYRHPYESLKFWGLKPGDTVVDLQPGGGYWTQILAPYAAQTGGVYEAGLADLSNPKLSDESRKGRENFDKKFMDQSRYGRIIDLDFGAVSTSFVTPQTVDLILTSREIHNWIAGDYLDKAMADCFAALKPGGVLAVEEHRADPRPQAAKASDGYVAVKTVVDAATRAGFHLDAGSEINANPKDTKDHPWGVWTLPPTRESGPDEQHPDPAFDHSKYDAIGESDRMTLRFRKPV